jgi:branched-chain amino acid transport system substrate-binding protein
MGVNTISAKRFLSILVILTLVVATALSMTACKPKVIKVASISPLSGAQSSMGEPIKLGVQMAIEERLADFKKLGFKIEFLPQDDQADPKVGVAVGQKLVADKEVLLYIGHLNSSVAIPTSEVTAKDNLAMVSPANTNPTVTERGLPNVNRICGRDDFQGPWGARYVKEDLKLSTVFIIHDKTTYGQGVAEFFKKKAEAIGLKVEGFEGITQGEVDFSPVLNKVKVKKPDLIFFGGMYPEAGQLVKQAREKKIDSIFMGADGIDDSGLLKVAGKAAVGVIYTTAAADVTKTPAGKAFAAKYETKFGKKPGAYSAYGYDSAMIGLLGLENAIKANKNKLPTRAQVSAEVRKVKGFKGIVGEVSFDAKGDNLHAKIYIFKMVKEEYPGELVKELAGKP